MPTINLHPLKRSQDTPDLSNAIPTLPSLLKTPSGLSLIEIQGTIMSERDASEISTALEVGHFVFPSEGQTDKRIYLFVGQHQQLVGELKKLPKPIALVRRRDNGASDEGDTELEVAEIVHYKILFSSRPEPVSQPRQS